MECYECHLQALENAFIFKKIFPFDPREIDDIYREEYGEVFKKNDLNGLHNIVSYKPYLISHRR